MNPIRLSLLQEQLEGVAEVMGSALARSAFSPNIRVRLDFSCALFTEHGDLLAQAAHIPVHLGSMPEQIKRLVATQCFEPGDIYIANDPYDGGTHLPDITLMEPVFTDDLKLLGVVAARAHHADVGGASPGSMASQKNIYGDGLRIPILRIVKNDKWEPQLLQLLLSNMRSPQDREGDLLAQRAACLQGSLGLRRVFEQWAGADLELWRDGPQALFQSSKSGALRNLDSWFSEEQKAVFCDHLEIGEKAVPISVELKRNDDGILVADFTGTSCAVAAGFNATLPVTEAAVCYVLRCLNGEGVALNQGFLDSIQVVAPPGCLVNARYPQAVAGGNVETSQRIVDVVFGAFAELCPQRVPAASAGTMNNLSFGFTDPSLGVHYETSGGGAGACFGGPPKACSGVQVHMTNTLATPNEILETEFPVMVNQHSFRPGSGGEGHYCGGDGTSKEITFQSEASVTFMTTRRQSAPYGMSGGQAGTPGSQEVWTPNTGWSPSAASSTHLLPADGRIRLSTPGGGAWGQRKTEKDSI